MLQNGQTELRKVCLQSFRKNPKAYIDINKSLRHRVSDFCSKTFGFIHIVEWRSLFVAKRHKMNKNRISCDFSTLFCILGFAKIVRFINLYAFLRSGLFLHLLLFSCMSFPSSQGPACRDTFQRQGRQTHRNQPFRQRC